MDWSVSSAVLITDGVAAIVGQPVASRGSLFAVRAATAASSSARER